ncbi:MAG: hypothetical protein ACYC2Z_00845 [Candidatus Nanopelagicales bacterium]
MSVIRRQWFALTAGLICFGWALLGWLTVIPNQDILADGIQAQSLLTDPRIVLSFPGQKHGGPLEYPATILAEAVFPGNYFANAAIRPLLAFATGFVVARLFLALFAKAPRWAFLVAMAVGPAIINGLIGPAGNTVGVWWLQPNWDMAWLLASSGALVLASALGPPGSGRAARPSVPWVLLAGLFLGLGFFAHPAIILLIVPLVTLVVLRSRWSPTAYLLVLAGALAGVVPAAISYVVNARISTWDPSHGAFIAVDYYRSMGGSVLGLDGIPDYTTALLPYSMGLAPSNGFLPAGVQSTIVRMFVLIILVCSVVAIVRALRGRRPLSPGGAIATTWLVAMLTMLAFITFVDPVWIYSSGVGVLFWLSVGALPMLITPRWVGSAAAVAVVVVAGLSTLVHNAGFYSAIPARFHQKIDAMNGAQDVAQRLLDEGAGYVFGSYYDVIPIGYASGSRLRTITNHYNRFPLSEQELQQPSVVVAANAEPTDPWGQEAWDQVVQNCTPLPVDRVSTYQLFTCPPAALAFDR